MPETMRADRHLIVVAPHPDDETLALGGTIYDHLRAGGSVEIVAVTDGEGADDRADREARAALALRRDEERRNALVLLGADRVPVTRLGLPDRDVSAHQLLLAPELQRIFIAARREFPACVVALPWRDDPHADHRATARAGLEAAVRAGVGLRRDADLGAGTTCSGGGGSRRRGCAGSRSAGRPRRPSGRRSAASRASSSCCRVAAGRCSRTTSSSASPTGTR